MPERRFPPPLFVAVHESAFGTKRTSRHAQPMSAFGGKADMKWTRLNVRLWPQADIGSQQPDSAYPPIVRGNCYSAATATSAIYCEIQAFRRFTLAR